MTYKKCVKCGYEEVPDNSFPFTECPECNFVMCESSSDYCSDCGIKRTKSPKPGTCPCCFSKMTAKLVTHGTYKQTIYSCTNNDCRRCCTESYLSGFWSGWKEKERQIL